jgi:hypothetical protein
MKIRNIMAGAGLAATAFVLASGANAQVTVGTFSGGNCYPFLCNDSGTSVGQSIDYQQVYSSSAFSTPTTFDGITFYDFPAIPGPVIAGNYDITFGTTTAALGSGYPVALSNVETFYDGTLSAGSGGTYTIDGAPYSYNPADGNLVMEVVVTNQANVPNGSGNGYFESDTSGTDMSRAYLITGQGGVADGTGLVTTFDVPEPAAWALMLTGFAGLGGVLRSRRRTVANLV